MANVRLEQAAEDCYCDPAFEHEEGACGLAVRLWKAGMLGFAGRVGGTVSLFAVIKGYAEDGARALRP
eukprot:5045217-Lingulodinium_polyedra.AAC.1